MGEGGGTGARLSFHDVVIESGRRVGEIDVVAQGKRPEHVFPYGRPGSAPVAWLADVAHRERHTTIPDRGPHDGREVLEKDEVLLRRLANLTGCVLALDRGVMGRDVRDWLKVTVWCDVLIRPHSVQ